MGWLNLSSTVSYVVSKLPRPRSDAMKRSLAVTASFASLLALIGAALYFRRKRQKRIKGKGRSEVERKNKTNEEFAANGLTLSPSGVKRLRNRRKRNNSFSPSLTSSAGSSSRVRLNKPLVDGKSLQQIEQLYQEGVNSFESALGKWEEASVILQTGSPTCSAAAASPSSSRSHRRLEFSGKRNTVRENRLLRSNRVRRYSYNTSSPTTPHGCVRSGSFTLGYDDHKLNNNHCYSDKDISKISSLLDTSTSVDDIDKSLFDDKLHSIVERAQLLQDAFDHILYDDSDTGSDTDMTLTGHDDEISDVDSESNDSFVSARESWDTFSLDGHPHSMLMYEQALLLVEKGEVLCRTYRSELLDCFSDDEFLAKLHCVRQGISVMLEDLSVRSWLTETGRAMIECILCAAERSTDDFRVAFHSMMDYVADSENWKQINEELKSRKVVQMTFYDVILDFMIMDSFDDLDQPPSAVMAILSNRWLSDSLKESAVSTAIWSVLKAKRSRLKDPEGFVSHLYDISQHVTPALVWGFLGPDGRLKEMCHKFKHEVIRFLTDLFSFERVRYSTPSQMSDDILIITRERFTSLLEFLHDPQLQLTPRNIDMVVP
uniref:Mitoguardin 2-like n=1 Tax=Ciona intestinalis TaxID=7719 RepID=A0A1W5BKL9_CIOIN|nr:mitoguardin 2-like isoform X1 [Ciona intestinalis]XP_018670713.1 mitoguardin 2-like isoform X1 [Ciona intestinalis]XP_026693762.1 mitoguardin 2-like isoform X1 [Ciona intestinalis]|eukprot:XP_018670712.1 mitoguardin 2-like isoform X1 [Ciona intestinalis]